MIHEEQNKDRKIRTEILSRNHQYEINDTQLGYEILKSHMINRK